ncbi:MAG TPA: DUF2770 family protein [Scandinavium sp.]|jgi:hypothetical protein
MQRICNYLVNNIREHFVLWLVLWLLLAAIDLIWILFY